MRKTFACYGFLFLLPLLLHPGCAPSGQQYLPPEGRYDVRILRDEWGVPHIFGQRDADVAYGLGFAHSEDDWTNMEDAVLMGRGRMAAVYGKSKAEFDYIFQLFRVREFVDAQYEAELSADFKALLEGYADGITHFAALNPKKMPHIALPVTAKDILCGATFKVPFFYKLHETLQGLMAKDKIPISSKGVVGQAIEPKNPLFNDAMIGSNGWAVAPARSTDGCTRLAVNSHMPFEGPVAFYEVHLHSEQGWDMLGPTFPGGPVAFMGHDPNKGWVHTINRPDLCDVYELTLNPDNKNEYRFDGKWKAFERKRAWMTIRLWGGLKIPVFKEMIWSVHGPALRTPKGVFALCFAGYGEIRHLEQWYRMNKAANLAEFKTAMRMNAIPSFNTVYADKHGDLFYAYNGQFPVRAPGYAWQKHLPGDTSKTLWQGRIPFDELPQLTNPASGFLQSCNSSPFHTTEGPDNPKPEDFPPEMGIETHYTNRSARALSRYGEDPAITKEEFYAYKYDKRYGEKSGVYNRIQSVINAEMPDEPYLKEAQELLRSWDYAVDKENPAAALALYVYHGQGAGESWGNAGKDPVAVLRGAAKYMIKKHGRLDPPWASVMRLRRGDKEWGLGGGPDCLRAIDPIPQEDGTYTAINGDCYFQFVEWNPQGEVFAEAVHQYGAATLDADSPHYADQAPLFAEERLRPCWITEEDIRAHLKREYRPGEIKDPWHRF